MYLGYANYDKYVFVQLNIVIIRQKWLKSHRFGGSADLSNAADGIDSIGTASLATDNAEPLRLSQVMLFL